MSLDEEELREIIENEDRGMGDIIQSLPNSQKYFLFIDQFEEVFTVCSREWERKRFINLITQINAQTNPSLAIVTTMRADFLDRCLQYQPLSAIIQRQAIYMPPLEGMDLQDIIIKPAQCQGYGIENGLLLQLLDDVGKEQGFLPLLEFALTLLWAKRDEERKVLTLQAYQQLGERSPLTPLNKGGIDESVGAQGLRPQESTEINENGGESPLAPLGKGGTGEKVSLGKGGTAFKVPLLKGDLGGSDLGGLTGLTKALDIYAEKVYHYRDYDQDNPTKKRTETEKEWIKLIFLRLIRTGNQAKDTRQRQPKEILLNIAGNDANQQKALNKLIDGKQGLVNARLLVTGSDIPPNPKSKIQNLKSNWVDLVHEALIEGWGRFAKWCEEDRDLRRLSDRLEDQRREWLNHPLDDNLMMGGLLAQVRQQWEGLRPYLLYPQEAEAFYRDSDNYEKKRLQELEDAKKQRVRAERSYELWKKAYDIFNEAQQQAKKQIPKTRDFKFKEFILSTAISAILITSGIVFLRQLGWLQWLEWLSRLLGVNCIARYKSLFGGLWRGLKNDTRIDKL